MADPAPAEQRRILHPRREQQRHPNLGAPLDVLCSQIAKEARKIASPIVDATSDCGAYARMVATSHTVNALLQAAANVHIFCMTESDAAVSAGSVGPLPTLEQLNQARRDLIDALYNSGAKLGEVYHQQGKPTSAYDNVTMLLIKTYAIIFYMTEEDKARELEQETLDGNEWATANNLVPVSLGDEAGPSSFAKTPILAYRMSQLTRALYLLNSRWSQLDYSLELVHYTTLLMIRSGMFLLCTFDSHTNDIEEMRTEIHAPHVDRDFPLGEYETSPVFVSSVGSVFVEMVSLVAVYLSLKKATPAECAEEFGGQNTAYIYNALVDWLRRKVDTMVATDSSDFLKDHLLRLNIRPGEQRGYMRMSAGVGNLTDVQYVISKFRKNEYGELCSVKNSTFVEVIKTRLLNSATPPASATGAPHASRRLPCLRRRPLYSRESTELALCLLELFNMHIKATYQGMEFSDFFILEYQLQDRQTDLAVVNEPIILQVFHRYHIWFQRKLFRCGSLIRAVVLWLTIIEHRFAGLLKTRDLRPWLKDVISMGGREPSMRKFWLPSPTSSPTPQAGEEDEDGEDEEEEEEEMTYVNDTEFFDDASRATGQSNPSRVDGEVSDALKRMVVDSKM